MFVRLEMGKNDNLYHAGSSSVQKRPKKVVDSLLCKDVLCLLFGELCILPARHYRNLWCQLDGNPNNRNKPENGENDDRHYRLCLVVLRRRCPSEHINRLEIIVWFDCAFAFYRRRARVNNLASRWIVCFLGRAIVFTKYGTPKGYTKLKKKV